MYEVIEVLVFSPNPVTASQAQDITLNDSQLSAYRHLGATTKLAFMLSIVEVQVQRLLKRKIDRLFSLSIGFKESKL